MLYDNICIVVKQIDIFIFKHFILSPLRMLLNIFVKITIQKSQVAFMISFCIF